MTAPGMLVVIDDIDDIKSNSAIHVCFGCGGIDFCFCSSTENPHRICKIHGDLRILCDCNKKKS